MVYLSILVGIDVVFLKYISGYLSLWVKPLVQRVGTRLFSQLMPRVEIILGEPHAKQPLSSGWAALFISRRLYKDQNRQVKLEITSAYVWICVYSYYFAIARVNKTNPGILPTPTADFSLL